MLPGVAHAEPTAARVRRLAAKVENLGEDYHAAKAEHRKTTRKLERVRKDEAEQRERAQETRRDVASIAAEAYQGGPSGGASVLLSGSPEDFIDRTVTLEQVSQRQDESLAAHERETAKLSARSEERRVGKGAE